MVAGTSYNHSTRHTDVQSLRVTMKDGVEISYAAAGRSLPISFSSSGPQEHSWHYNNDITALTLVTCARGSNCSEAPFHNRRPLPLPKHPLLAEVTAASSASLGFPVLRVYTGR